MSLLDLLACPHCKVKVDCQKELLICPQCGLKYPIINGVPVMFPDGSVPEIVHQAELQVRPTYDPWVHRAILQSLNDDQVVLDVGSGNVSLDDPNIIRMDITLTQYVDLVADLHALPFLPGSVDYIFSLAVFEHLRNPFLAAQSIYDTLKDGGYIYHECNFIFAYHGFPHHYFNASLQGMEQIFAQYTHLRKGVATYQMPSFALDNVLRTYLNKSHANEYPHGRVLVERLQQILNMDLTSYDIYFNEADTQYVAAGTYLSGYKQETPESSLIPAVIQAAWDKDPILQARFCDLNNLTTVDNVMVWARGEGRQQVAEIDAYFQAITPFNKRGQKTKGDRSAIRAIDLQEPYFGAIGYNPRAAMAENAAEALRRSQSGASPAVPPKRAENLARRALETIHQQGLRALLHHALEYLSRRI
jgi:uncharacterized protein YbaR (Trm112 family)/SAM-dependent methyltransferase